MFEYIWLIVITIIIVVDSGQFSGGASKEKGSNWAEEVENLIPQSARKSVQSN